MNNFLMFLLRNSVFSCMVMILIVLAQNTVLRRYHKVTKFLWIVCLFHSVIPFELLKIRIKLVETAPEQHVSYVKATEVGQGYAAEFWTPYIIFTIWMLGIAFLMLKEVRAYKSYKQVVRFAARQCGNVYKSRDTKIAFTYGFFKQKIVLSADIAEEEEVYVIAHEKQHQRSKDNLFKLMYVVAKIFNWYNPVMWICQTHFSHFIELLCDKRATQGYSRQQIHDYALSLVHMATQESASSMVISGFCSKDQIKNRINELIDKKPKRSRMILCTLAMIIMGFITVAAVRYELPRATKVVIINVYSGQEPASEASDADSDEGQNAKVWLSESGKGIHYSVSPYGKEFIFLFDSQSE